MMNKIIKHIVTRYRVNNSINTIIKQPISNDPFKSFNTTFERHWETFYSTKETKNFS